MLRIIYAVFLVSLLLASCKNKEHNGAIHIHTNGESCSADHKEEIKKEEHTHENGITLSPKQAQMAGVKVVEVKESEFSATIKVGGKIKQSISDEQVIVATVSGVVRLNDNITVGSNVSTKDWLMMISSKSIGEGDHAEHRAIEYNIAKREYERISELAKHKIVAEKDLLIAKQKYENAKIDYDALGKNYTHSGQKILPPYSGYVKSLDVSNGEYVEVGRRLGVVSKSNKMQLVAEVPQRYYHLLRNIQTANIVSANDSKVYEIENNGGKLLSYGKSLNDGYYVPVTFEMNNIDGLINGTFVEVYLILNSKKNSISIPLSSISIEQGATYVYKQPHKDLYEKQEVVLGQNNGVITEVIKGVKKGDRIVTSGVQSVKMAGASNSIPGHTH